MMSDGPFFNGDLFPEDTVWLINETIVAYKRLGWTTLKYERDVARTANILRHQRGETSRRRRAAKVFRRISSVRPPVALRGSGRPQNLSIFAVNGSLSNPIHGSIPTRARIHCAYCGGPIDSPQTILPDGFRPLFGVKLGPRWYHRELCLAKCFKTE